MRSSSSSINPIFNQNSSSSSSSKSSGISRKPTSALSKIGKHVPPPISPIIAFKSTTSSVKSSNTAIGSGLANKSEIKNEKTNNSSSLATTSTTSTTTTCAWRLPKATEPQVNPVPATVNYPQRKVPELTPMPVNVVVAVKESEKPKGFLERFEDFPNLLKQQPPSVSSTAKSETQPPVLPPPRPPQKLLGGDFNFLEDDDWLDGDNIDYSQNLFEDDDHFLPSYILEETRELNTRAAVNSDHSESGVHSGTVREDHTSHITQISHISHGSHISQSSHGSHISHNTHKDHNNTKKLCHIKAKSLLAERCHSSKKNDIWKRTEDKEIEPEASKIKIKILKRPELPAVTDVPSVKVAENEDGKLVKKFSTSLKLSTKKSETQDTKKDDFKANGADKNDAKDTKQPSYDAKDTKKQPAPADMKEIAPAPAAPVSKTKIVYSSASKTLQKL